MKSTRFMVMQKTIGKSPSTVVPEVRSIGLNLDIAALMIERFLSVDSLM